MPRPYTSKRPTDSDLPNAVNQLRTASRLRQSVTNTLTAQSLTWPLLDVLLSIREIEEAVGVRELGRRVSPTADVPRAIGRLEDLGYVRLDPHPTDGRKQAPTLTEEGHHALQNALLAVENSDPQPTKATPAT